MPRPIICRRIEQFPLYRSFSPDDITASESIYMTIDEFETLRLLDNKDLTQKECATKMNISRTTVTAIYDSARKKVAEALVMGKRLLITGGRCEIEPIDIQQEIMEKGNTTMRIAVTYENGEVFQHFGHTAQFKLYDVENGNIVSEQIVDTNESGHGALAGFLQAVNADALICGGIGMGAQMALSDAGIKLYAGVQGAADKAAKNLVEGTLEFHPDARCDHHEHDGDYGEKHHRHKGACATHHTIREDNCEHEHCSEHHSRGN